MALLGRNDRAKAQRAFLWRVSWGYRPAGGIIEKNPHSAFARTGLSPSSFLKIWKQAIGVGTC